MYDKIHHKKKKKKANGPNSLLCPQLFLLVCVHDTTPLFYKLGKQNCFMKIFAETARHIYASPFFTPCPHLTLTLEKVVCVCVFSL